MKHRKRRIATPAGDMTLVAHDRALVALVWEERELARLGLAEAGTSSAAGRVSAAERVSEAEPGSNDPLAIGARQLEEYFRGERTGFDVPLDPTGTPFQRAVWDQLVNIPYGSTWSYRELALRVGNPGAVRAVGTANGRNPLCIFIPCHRVVRATGETGGYAGGIERKVFLLGMEAAAIAVPGGIGTVRNS
jgi:methylated-DNA-[protein]-cysteine S-methyltransferase